MQASTRSKGSKHLYLHRIATKAKITQLSYIGMHNYACITILLVIQLSLILLHIPYLYSVHILRNLGHINLNPQNVFLILHFHNRFPLTILFHSKSEVAVCGLEKEYVMRGSFMKVHF